VTNILLLCLRFINWFLVQWCFKLMNWSQCDYNLILGTYNAYNNINIILKVTNQCFKQMEQKDNHIIVILYTWLVGISSVLFKHKFFLIL